MDCIGEDGSGSVADVRAKPASLEWATILRLDRLVLNSICKKIKENEELAKSASLFSIVRK